MAADTKDGLHGRYSICDKHTEFYCVLCGETECLNVCVYMLGEIKDVLNILGYELYFSKYYSMYYVVHDGDYYYLRLFYYSGRYTYLLTSYDEYDKLWKNALPSEYVVTNLQRIREENSLRHRNMLIKLSYADIFIGFDYMKRVKYMCSCEYCWDIYYSRPIDPDVMQDKPHTTDIYSTKPCSCPKEMLCIEQCARFCSCKILGEPDVLCERCTPDCHLMLHTPDPSGCAGSTLIPIHTWSCSVRKECKIISYERRCAAKEAIVDDISRLFDDTGPADPPDTRDQQN